jgi:hypothetical protein
MRKYVILVIILFSMVIVCACKSSEPNLTTSNLTTAETSTNQPTTGDHTNVSTTQPSAATTSSTINVPTPTPEPTPIAIMPVDILDSLGTGLSADLVWGTLGLSPMPQSGKIYRFQIGNSSDLFCDLEIFENRDTHIIKTASTIHNGVATLLFKPIPDITYIDDFQIIFHDEKIGLGHTDDLTIQNKLGEPQSAETKIVTDETGRFRIRTLFYNGLEIRLLQSPTTTTPNEWTLFQLTVRNSEYKTARGIKTGMTYSAVMRLLGTGEIDIYPDPLLNPVNMGFIKHDTDHLSSDKDVNIKFNQEGQITEMVFTSFFD